MEQPLSLGRVVLVVLPPHPSRPHEERIRPARVVSVISEFCANLAVDLDTSDAHTAEDLAELNRHGFKCCLNNPVARIAGSDRGARIGDWHWPPFVGKKPERSVAEVASDKLREIEAARAQVTS